MRGGTGARVKQVSGGRGALDQFYNRSAVGRGHRPLMPPPPQDGRGGEQGAIFWGAGAATQSISSPATHFYPPDRREGG